MNVQYSPCCGCLHYCNLCNRSDSCHFFKRCTCAGRTENASTIRGDFREAIQCLNLETGTNFTNSFLAREARRITAFIKNTGDGPITAFLQYSPNNLDFVDDPHRMELAAGNTGHLVPYIFCKYMRIAVTGTSAGSARIWIQMQRYRYFQHPAGTMPCGWTAAFGGNPAAVNLSPEREETNE
ncbi:MAG: DUF6385 domain-containing protein [Christensenellales bacterium]|jgi:hypothetical protein